MQLHGAMQFLKRWAVYLILLLLLVEASEARVPVSKELLLKLKSAIPKLIKRLPAPVRSFLKSSLKFFATVLAFVGLDKGVESVSSWLFSDGDSDGNSDGKIEVKLPSGELMRFDPKDMQVRRGTLLPVSSPYHPPIIPSP